MHTWCFNENTFFNLFSNLENPCSTFNCAVLNFLVIAGAERLQQTRKSSYEDDLSSGRKESSSNIQERRARLAETWILRSQMVLIT